MKNYGIFSNHSEPADRWFMMWRLPNGDLYEMVDMAEVNESKGVIQLPVEAVTPLLEQMTVTTGVPRMELPNTPEVLGLLGLSWTNGRLQRI